MADKFRKHGPREGFVFTQTMIGKDPHDPPGVEGDQQDYDIDVEKIIEKVNMLNGAVRTYASGEVDNEQLFVYFNLPGKDAPGCPDINITIKDGKLESYGLGPCLNKFGGCKHEWCTQRDHEPLRWLALEGIVRVIEGKGPAEPFLRFLNSIYAK